MTPNLEELCEVLLLLCLVVYFVMFEFVIHFKN